MIEQLFDGGFSQSYVHGFAADKMFKFSLDLGRASGFIGTKMLCFALRS